MAGPEDLCGEGDGVGTDGRVRVDVVVGRDTAAVVGGLQYEEPMSPVARDGPGDEGRLAFVTAGGAAAPPGSIVPRRRGPAPRTRAILSIDGRALIRRIT